MLRSFKRGICELRLRREEEEEGDAAGGGGVGVCRRWSTSAYFSLRKIHYAVFFPQLPLPISARSPSSSLSHPLPSPHSSPPPSAEPASSRPSLHRRLLVPHLRRRCSAIFLATKTRIAFLLDPSRGFSPDALPSSPSQRFPSTLCHLPHLDTLSSRGARKKSQEDFRDECTCCRGVRNGNASSSTTAPRGYLPNGGCSEKVYNQLSNELSFLPGGFPSLRLPLVVTSQETNLIARCRTYAHAHDYHINSISNNRYVSKHAFVMSFNKTNHWVFLLSPSDGETLVSADDLRINLWNLEISNQSFNIVDVKPANMEDLIEVITSAEFHPTHCNLPGM